MEAGVLSPRVHYVFVLFIGFFLTFIHAQYSIRRFQPLCNRCGCCKPRYVNPCSQGPPILTPFGQPAYCNWKASNSCPSTHFCHVGVTVVTTCCCPMPGDPCDMPPSSGQGTATLPRFFYDKISRSCKPFMYRGLLGNANNFITRELCEATCPALQDPCALGPPASDPLGGRVSCSVVSPNSCPVGYWCHIGPTADTTACCRGTGPPCALPLRTGQGSSSLPRWYFDVQTGSCRQFTYLGTKGNQNNFLTRGACEATCQTFENPCVVPVNPATAVSCSPPGLNPTPCPPGMWCHVGATPQTTLCCPGAVSNPCGLTLSLGEGNESLSRWFYDFTDGLCGTCKLFTYRGLKGNQNNFLTQLQCRTACPPCVNPCGRGEPLMGFDNRPRPCSRSSVCPTNYYCHVGATPDTTVCCLASGNPCEQPMTVGTGTVALQRFYYDQFQRSCVPFTYRGLRGNQNNFLTLQDCEAMCFTLINPCPVGEPLLVAGRPRQCAPTSPCPASHWCHVGADPETTVCCPITGNPCELPLSVGQGQNSLPRWYFDPTTPACVRFTYRGLQGNQNNFLSQQDCEAVCPVFENPCPTGNPPTDPTGRPVSCSPQQPCAPTFWCHLGAGPETTTCCPNAGDPCRMPRTEGIPGRIPVSLSRWYFDQNTQQCQTFIYRGLKGNQNNFPTLASCQQTCAEINPCQPPDTPFIQPGDGFLRCQGGAFNNCPTTHFCLVGADPQTSACCPRRGSPCDQPQVEGTGVSNLPRWSYDSARDECVRFAYRGLQGNENNFLTQGDCEDTCARFKDFCPHGTPLLIDQEPQSCSVETACPQEFVCHINAAPQISLSVCCPAPASFCFLDRDPGRCNQAETRFGYEPSTNTCVEFRYSGCGGNLNNFRTLEKCTDICCNQF